MEKISFGKGIRSALLQEMERDENIFLAGEDISWGGLCGQYRGFVDKFPGRILDTPITETALAGLGLGAALMGLRPVIDFNLMDFSLVAMDEICNQIAKFRYMNGGDTPIPLVLLMSGGADMVGSAAQHSQSLEALYAHIPGLKVVYPSNAADAKGLLISALRGEDPVIFIQHMRLRKDKCEVLEENYVIPLGRASRPREGEDVTLISYGAMMPQVLKAADMLSDEGIRAEVIDLRTLVPLDKKTLLASVKKTGRAVVVHEAVKQGGFGAEVAAFLAEEAFDSLKMPIRRMGAPFCPVPFSPALKSAYYVSAQDIFEEVMRVFSKYKK